MDGDYLRECEDRYLRAAQALDTAQQTYAENWMMYRSAKGVTTDSRADNMANSDGIQFNVMRAELNIARLKFERALSETRGN